MELTWLPYVIVAALVAGGVWFTLGRAGANANTGRGPIDRRDRT
jgi:hypothetical protein